MMTTLKEVEKELNSIDYPLAVEWKHNDIVKMKLAMSYDAWMNDIWDHGHECTLREHIIDMINREDILEMINLPGIYPGK